MLDDVEPSGDPVSAPDPTQTSTWRRHRGEGFRALDHAGYRLYFGGMLLRGTAAWTQLLAVPLLAVDLGASPFELGVVTALLFLPTLFIAALGGVLADRVDRARVLLITQALSGTLSLVLFGLVATGIVSLPWVALAAVCFGTLTAIELPVRQAFLTELVPADDVSSAVSLHATAWNTTRFVGPVVAGLLIATVGMAATFLAAAVVAFVVSASVPAMDRRRVTGRRGPRPDSSVLVQLKEGARFAAGEATVRWPLIIVAAVGILGIQAFQTLAPLFGTQELGLDPGMYGVYIGLWGAGGVVAAIGVTAFAHGDRRRWILGGTLALAAILAAIAVTLAVLPVLVLAFFLGIAQVSVIQNAMISIQTATPDGLRGRVMGIYVTVFQGTSPFGAILAGTLATLVGVRGAMLMGAVALGVLGAALVVGSKRLGWGATPEPALRPSDTRG